MDEALSVSLITVVILSFAAAILLHSTHPALLQTKLVYEQYFDIFVVIAIAIISVALFGLSIYAYRRDGNPRLAYVSGAFFLYAIRMVLTLMDMLSGPNHWLVDSAVHIIDLGILLLFFLGVIS